jgi:hypothetical protein
MIITFKGGLEKQYDADSAAISGPLFVIYKYNNQTGKDEIRETFPAAGVVLATLPDGHIVVGKAPTPV